MHIFHGLYPFLENRHVSCLFKTVKFFPSFRLRLRLHIISRWNITEESTAFLLRSYRIPISYTSDSFMTHIEWKKLGIRFDDNWILALTALYQRHFCLQRFRREKMKKWENPPMQFSDLDILQFREFSVRADSNIRHFWKHDSEFPISCATFGFKLMLNIIFDTCLKIFSGNSNRLSNLISHKSIIKEIFTQIVVSFLKYIES